MTYTFTFPVHAISKDNEKLRARNGRYFLSKRFKDFEENLRIYFYAQKPKDFKILDEGDLAVTLNYTFKNRIHADIGNLPKSTLDAFNRIIWKDDRQIHHLSIDVNYGDIEEIRMEVSTIPSI